ncbi:hypothetical protein DY000_02017657 [Brassica cretica]|uniref:RRM domain-containing protein n=1 Tax=Brassica cretica TaxID=69181 RepID=A0ABQ7D7M9_BRACR|nr:hypothetical protein DY000_02017657 [Brassica cretica]
MVMSSLQSIKVRLHGESIRVNKDTKSLDVGANLFIGNLDHASISLGAIAYERKPKTSWMKDNRRKRDRHSRRKAATEERRRMKAVKDKEKAIDDGEEDREKRSLMESGTKLRPGYMVINNGMIHYQSKAIKVFNMIKLHGKSIRVNKDTKSLDVGANLFIGNLDHASIYLGVLHFRSCKDRDTMNSRGFGFISYGSYDASHAATESLKLTRKTPTASTYKSVIICATSTMFKRIGLPKPNLNSEYSQRLSTLLCRKVWSRSKSLREKLTSLWSENITEVAREGGSDEVELNWDSYEKANQEISSDKLKLAEEKAITKEQDKMRAEEAAHGKYREDEESCGKKYIKRERETK